MKTIFKVALPFDNGDEAWISCFASGSYALTYRIGKETKAIKNTLGILVFKELKHAKAFMLHEQGLINSDGLVGKWFEVLECETKGRLKAIESLAFPSSLDTFYACLDSKVVPIISIPPPPGTYACKSITPILKVKL